MKIFFSGTQKKLPVTDPSKLGIPDEVLYGNEPWFYVVHTGGTIATFLKEDEDQHGDKEISTCVEKGGGVLFVSGQAACELSEEEVLSYEKQYNNRVHFFRFSCPDDIASNSAKRIMDFLTEIENLKAHQNIPWNLLDTRPVPQNLLALYFLVKAVDSFPEKAENFSKTWQDMDRNWQEAVIKQAISEFKEKSNDTEIITETIFLDSREINPNFLRSVNVRNITNLIGDCLSRY